MSYEFYKILHFTCLFITISGIGINFFLPELNKKLAIGVKVSSILILVSGMGLHAKTGGVWETWVYVKLTIWLLVMVLSAVFLKRFREKGPKLFPVFLVLFFFAAYTAVTKY